MSNLDAVPYKGVIDYEWVKVGVKIWEIKNRGNCVFLQGEDATSLLAQFDTDFAPEDEGFGVYLWHSDDADFLMYQALAPYLDLTPAAGVDAWMLYHVTCPVCFASFEFDVEDIPDGGAQASTRFPSKLFYDFGWGNLPTPCCAKCSGNDTDDEEDN